MWRFLCLALVLFMTFTNAHAQTISFTDLLNRPQPSATHRLSYGNDPNQFGDLYLPDNVLNPPIIIMIHGGCWQASLPGVALMSYISEDMRQNGYAVWNIEYRRLGHKGGGYPGTFLDVGNAVDYLRQIAPTYHLDLSRVSIVGHSAGGHLALWAAVRAQLDPASPVYTANPLPVKSVTTLSGINDLQAYRDHGPNACGGPQTIDQLINAQTRTNPYADTSPSAMLPLKTPQHIITGALDPIVPPSFGQAYAALAHADYTEIKSAGHFELIDPTSIAWAEIKKQLMKP